MSGKDARRYLHNRLSQDIRSLSVGSHTQAAALSAQGRIEGYFSVFCSSDSEFLLIADGGDSATLQSIIGRFVVADRVIIKDLSQAVSLVHIAASEHAVRDKLMDAHMGYLCCYARPRIAAEGVDILVEGERFHHLQEFCREHFGAVLSQHEYDLLRWKAGIPGFPQELTDQLILTEAGIAEAVCFSKGCYVGQEVIERSDAVGKLPRALERCVLPDITDVEQGDAVVNQRGESIGKVVSAYADRVNHKMCLFVLLKTGKYAAGELLQCGGTSTVLVERGRML